MCFSPEADLVAGVVVSGVGIDALRHVKQTREYPLASLPLLLGVHLLVEVYVWWGEAGRVPEYVGQTATWVALSRVCAGCSAGAGARGDSRRRRRMSDDDDS